MNQLKQILDQIPRWGKAVGWLATAVGVGVVLAGWLGLPEQVAANSDAILANTQAVVATNQRVAALERSDSTLLHDIRRVICILQLPENTRPIDAEKACP